LLSIIEEKEKIHHSHAILLADKKGLELKLEEYKIEITALKEQKHHLNVSL
jgi:hypothetical protein